MSDSGEVAPTPQWTAGTNEQELLTPEAAHGKRAVRLLSHQESAETPQQSPAAAEEEVKYQEIATILRSFVSHTEDVDGASVETCIEALKRKVSRQSKQCSLPKQHPS